MPLEGRSCPFPLDRTAHRRHLGEGRAAALGDLEHGLDQLAAHPRLARAAVGLIEPAAVSEAKLAVVAEEIGRTPRRKRATSCVSSIR